MAAFGLPNFGQLKEAFQKAQQIQQNAQKVQEELEEMELEGRSQNNKVKIWLAGNQKPIRIKIEESLMNESKEIIEETLMEAFLNAYEISTDTMKSKMEEITGGLNLKLPGLDDQSE